MRRGSLCCRADLVRAMAGADPSVVDSLAEMLGFVVAPENVSNPVELVDKVDGTAAPSAIATWPAAVISREESEIQERPLVETPFWSLVGYETVSKEGVSKPRSVPLSEVDWRNRPTEPPKIRLLAPWRELQPRLRRVLAGLRDSEEVDLDRTIGRISRGRLLERFPRKSRRRWGPRLLIVIDRSEHLVPYWTDQDHVRGHLARLLTSQDLEQAVFYEGLTEPRILGVSPESSVFRPLPGGVVLVLGDLACLTSQGSREDNPWLELGQRIVAAGSCPVALLPCPISRCPAILRRSWRLIPWERPRSASVTEASLLRQRAERLLRLVSYSVRIEPGLLRAVRLSLGSDEADAGTESDVWQHSAVSSTHSEAATLDPKRARELRAALATALAEKSEDVQVHKRALQLLREWRADLPKEIWLNEVLHLPESSQDDLSVKADLEDARALFASVCDLLESGGDSHRDHAIRAWFFRVRERVPESFWNDPVIGRRVLVTDYLLHRDVPGYSPPVAFDPALAGVSWLRVDSVTFSRL